MPVHVTLDSHNGIAGRWRGRYRVVPHHTYRRVPRAYRSALYRHTIWFKSQIQMIHFVDFTACSRLKSWYYCDIVHKCYNDRGQYQGWYYVCAHQWETALLCNDVPRWLGASLEPALSILIHRVHDHLRSELWIGSHWKTDVGRWRCYKRLMCLLFPRSYLHRECKLLYNLTEIMFLDPKWEHLSINHAWKTMFIVC